MAARNSPHPSQHSLDSSPAVPPTVAYEGQGPVPGTPPSLSEPLVPGPEPPTLDDPRPPPEVVYDTCLRIGPYEVIDKLAEGGMGVVLKVRDTRLNRLVALKMVRGPLGCCGLGEVHRFHREAQVQARIQHRHILPIFDVGQHHGEQYFTMPLVTGDSLAKHQAEYTGQPGRVVPLLEKVARAVDYAHRHGIFHRDLKPSNILLDEEGEPLIADFGLAKLEDASCDLTAEHILGTPPYMAPEQTDPEQAHLIDARTDVWSLGVLLYELLTGQRPFSGANKTETFARVRKLEPTPPGRLKTDLDPGLERIILRCLEKERKWRYPSAAALADDLARWQRGEAIPVPPISQRLCRQVHRVPWAKVCAVTAILFLLALSSCLALRPYLNRGVAERPILPASLESDYADSIREQLRQGRAVTLIGANGNPQKYTLDTLGGVLKDSRRAAEERYQFYFASETSYRLELLPAGVLPPRYRISLELQYDLPIVPTKDADFGIVGIYLLRQRVTLSQNRLVDAYLTATIGRHETVIDEYKGRPELASVCYLLAHLHPLKNWPDGATELTWNTHYPVRPTAESRNLPRKWRTLVVEVRPSRVTVLLDGKTICQPTQQAILPLQMQPHDPLPITREEAPTAFPLDGGLGLYVHSARMFVRNLVIEPLEE